MPLIFKIFIFLKRTILTSDAGNGRFLHLMHLSAEKLKYLCKSNT